MSRRKKGVRSRNRGEWFAFLVNLAMVLGLILLIPLAWYVRWIWWVSIIRAGNGGH